MQTSDAAENQNYASVERLGNTVGKNVEEVHDLKVRVQELGFEAGHDEEEILTRSLVYFIHIEQPLQFAFSRSDKVSIEF